MPDWIVVVILGIIEGITEFIPVSSTGHLLVTEHLLRVHESDLFNIVIQCGAVIAVLPLFPQRIYKFVFELRDPETRDYLLKIATAFFITGAVGFVLDKKGFKLPENPAPIAVALLVGGIAFLAIEWWLRGRKLSNEITWPVVFAVAIGQLIAMVFPGSSRSGSTILLSLLLGVNRPAADGIFLSGRHSDHDGGGRPENFRGLPPPRRRCRAGKLGHGSAGHCHFRRRLLHRREMAAGLHPDAHVQPVRLVSHRAGDCDFHLPAALKSSDSEGRIRRDELHESQINLKVTDSYNSSLRKITSPTGRESKLSVQPSNFSGPAPDLRPKFVSPSL